MPTEVVANPAFPPTRWSVVLSARRSDDPAAAHAALTELCRLYWFPLYAFARRSGWSPEDAADLTQDFFARLLEENLFARTDPAAGRLRSFLLVAFQRSLSDARRTALRQKRGGGRTVLSLDRELAEERLQQEPSLQLPPISTYDRLWATSVLAASVGQLEADYAGAGKSDQFTALKPFLSPPTADEPSYEDAATRLGVTIAAARQSVHRLRERYRVTLRRHIADTLSAPTEAAIEEELASLRLALD